MTLDTRARQAVQGIDRAVEVMEMSTSTKVPHPIARFDRYRSHKQRNQRIGAALVAAALTIATILFVTGGFDRGQAPSPAGPVITPSNVGTLRLQWSASLDGAVPGQLTDQQTLPYPPTLANGAVYVGTQNGTLYSFPASCGSPGADCPPNWAAHLQGAAVYAPTVADDRVFVATDAGKLYAFPTDCASSCSPAWVGDVGRQFYASPVAADGFVYGVDVWDGRLYAFSETCGTNGAPCRPAWTAGLDSRLNDNLDCGTLGGCIVVAPAVANGTVFATTDAGAGEALHAFDARTGTLLWKGTPSDASATPNRFRTPVVDGGSVYVSSADPLVAYSTTCGTRGDVCSPLWTADVPDDGGLGEPVLADGTIYAQTSATVAAYPEDCGTGGTCGWTWEFASLDALASNRIAVGDGIVVETSYQDGSLQAIGIGCGTGGATCNPAWTSSPGALSHPGTAVISGGLVYVGTGDADVLAFPATCGTASCSPAWSFSGSGALSSPAVGNDAIYVAESGGRLLAFGPSSEENPGIREGGKRSAPLFYGALAILLIVVLLASLRRRSRVNRV